MDLSSELLCCENASMDLDMKCKSYLDPVLLKDNRVLESLLEAEEKYMPSPTYFACVQTDVQPKMREIVAHWMLNVCHEEQREEEVFALAMNLLDRFLSFVPMKRQQLQLLGTVCLLLSSKLKESPPLDAHKLVHYGDGAFKLEDLRAWELVVLSRLKWDLSAITPHAFLDQILERLQLNLSENDRQIVREHATFFIKVCATDSRFTSNPPSMVAAAAVASAVQSVMSRRCDTGFDDAMDSRFHPAIRGTPSLGDDYRGGSHESSGAGSPFDGLSTKRFMTNLYNRLHTITQIDTDCLRECHRQIEIWTQTNSESPTASASVTPTDVEDVVF